MNDRADSGSTGQGVAEISLMCVSVVVVISAGRLFSSGFELATFLALVGTAHLAAAGLRRAGAPMLVATAALLAAGALAVAWVFASPTLAWGVPTPHTFDTLAHDLQHSFASFRTLTAPVPATTGFLVALAATMWVLIVFADGAAFSADAPLPALLPLTAMFIFTSVLDRANTYLVLGFAYSVAVAVFAMSVRGMRQSHRAWAPGDRRIGLRSTRSLGVMMVVVTATAAAGLTPLLPGTGGKGVVDLRRIGAGSGPRQVDSPLIGLQSLLSDQSDTVMFTVQSAAPHYWRQTSLDEFNGVNWGSKANYREIGDGEQVERSAASAVPRHNERQTITIKGLSDIWLPAAFQPRSVRSDAALRYDSASSTLILDDGESTPDDRYVVDSAIASIDAQRLEDGGTRAPSPGDRYLELPMTFSPEVARLTRSVTADARSDYAVALALQDFFRHGDFVYDTTVDFRSSPDPLVSFLHIRRGFCQQYATAYAAMARSVGLASRVAVGFTYGDRDGSTWTVRGRNAHAWPEVYLAGAGWVAFEPTPGRGNPDATAYSGLDPDQDASPVTGSASTTTLTTVAGSTTVQGAPATSNAIATTGPPEMATTVPGDDRPDAATAPSGFDDGAWWFAGGLLLAVVAGLVLRLEWVQRRRARRHRPGESTGRRVGEIWFETRRDLRRLGIRPAPYETPDEFATRAAGAIGVVSLAELGPLETERRYASVELDHTLGERAAGISNDVREAVWARLNTLGRWRARFEL